MKQAFNWETLANLSNLYGISGREERILEYVKQQLPKEFVGTDRLGSGLFQTGRKASDGIHILVAAHMDEVGFIVSDIDEAGYIRLQAQGNMWTHVLLNQRVVVVTQEGKEYIGIIGSPSVHALSPDKRRTVLLPDQLFVDMGVTSKKEIEELGIRVGDMVCPDTKMISLANDQFLAGKAFDNRVSVAIGIEWIKHQRNQSIRNQCTFATTVQEEVGLRGARTVAHATLPDIAFAVDTTLATDTPLDRGNIQLGKGVAINVIDSMTMMNRGFLIYLEQLCKKKSIPYQLSCFTDGGTDAGNIHKSNKGILSTTLSIPMRYMHTHEGIIHKADVEAAVQLLDAVSEDITRQQMDRILEEDYLF